MVIVDDEVADLDPRFTGKALETKISKLVSAGLTTVDTPTMMPRPLLAERVEREDEVTWLVTVRADARFSDGTPVTADDVAYTFNSIMDPAVGSRYRKNFQERFEGIDVVDERRVRFRLKAPLATFMTDIDLGIVSATAARAGNHRFPDGEVIGAGPFRLVRLRPGEVVLERNRYYVEAPPPLRRVVIRTIRDTNARLLVLVGGSADLTQNTVRPDLLQHLGARRLQIQGGPSAILSYLMFNNRDPILRDRRVRHAIALAIDREKLVRGKLGGRAVLATGLIPPGHWAYSGDVTRWPYDPERARRLLDEAGYPDPDGPGGRPRFSLTYKTSSDAFRVSVARLIAQQLGEIGIDVEVRPFEFGVFLADLKQGNFQLASMQTAEIVEPDMYLVYFHSERIPTRDYPDGLNRWAYRSPAIDRLVEAGRHELDLERRKGIYAEIQRLLSEELPIFPLWHEDNVAVMNVDVVGYEVLPNARITPIARTSKR